MVTWLQRHDREAGDLYGTLPLCVGMPVAATDHLDRERGVLRGCSGRVCGWTHDTPNAEPSKQDGEVRFWTKLPSAVYVQFKTKRKWRVKGMGNDCILPVAPVCSVWHLDQRRKYPKLKVSRRQLPLCPYFAITAHAAQGLTMREGAIADIAIRAGDDPLTLRRSDARGRSRTPAHISPLCPGAFPARGRRGAKPVAPSMERRGDRLGEDPTRVHHREAMQRVPGTQRATRLHGRAVEARGYEPRV